MGRECSRLDPSYQRHITFACTCCYTNYTPYHHLGIIIPRLIAGTNLPTPEGWIAWLAKADCTHINFAQGYYTIESKRHRKEMNPGCRIQDQLNINEPTAPYIIGREFNLRKTARSVVESNLQPSEQLQPMTIKTSASTETVTIAYICGFTQFKLVPCFYGHG